jgi:predicted lipid-binding transport protein (Tim44 family)
MRFLVILLLVSGLLLTPLAEAKKMGGGANIGRSAPAERQATPNNASPQNAAAPAAARPGGFFGGLMAGMLAMGLFGMLLMGGGSILLLLLLAVGIFFLFKFLTRAKTPEQQQPAYAYSAPAAGTAATAHHQAPATYAGQGGMNVPAIGSGVSAVNLYKNPEGLELMANPPAWFDEARFLSAATQFFHELNQAWEQGDFQKIGEFTTADVLAELRQQHAALTGNNQTFFQQVTATLLALHRDGDTLLATVEFRGEERENRFGAWVPFVQLWVIERDMAQANAPWLIAGMQDGDDTDETSAY